MAGTRTLGRRLGLIGLGLGVLAALALAGWWYAIHWRPSATDYPLQGIDVSSQTGAIDWPTVRAAGADLAYIRATASIYRDPAFAANWSDARAAGLRRGALHVYSFCTSATDQANTFIVTVPRVSDALPAAVSIGDWCDAWPKRARLIEDLARFARVVESHTGKPLILLITPAIEAKYDLARAFERPVWATGNYFPPTYLSRPWRMWRANGRRRIEGADRAVGWNVVAP